MSPTSGRTASSCTSAALTQRSRCTAPATSPCRLKRKPGSNPSVWLFMIGSNTRVSCLLDEGRCCLHQWHMRTMTLRQRKVAVVWLKGLFWPVQAALAYDLAAVKFRGRSAATNYDTSAFERELAQLDEVRPSL